MSPRPAGAHLRESDAGFSDAEGELMAADRRMAKLMKTLGPLQPERDRRGSREDPYEALARAICGQQLSTKAAATIWGRIEALFGGGTPNPKQVIAADPQALRDAGLSWSKVSYFRDLAERVQDGALDVGRLPQLSDEEVIEELTAIKGIGRWTAEMFLIFHLMRPNVLPLDDPGLISGISQNYFSGDPVSRSDAREVAVAWAPYCSVATWYIWRSLDPLPVAHTE
jgi:DNA-3-methyladenine glycosylase II